MAEAFCVEVCQLVNKFEKLNLQLVAEDVLRFSCLEHYYNKELIYCNMIVIKVHYRKELVIVNGCFSKYP